jgi:uncharacterized Ntn-hydrolase superfamily protein
VALRPRFGRVWLILDLSTVPILHGRGAGTCCRSLHAGSAAEGNRRNDESIFNQILKFPSMRNYSEASVSGRIGLSHSAVRECDLCRQEAP